MKTTGKTTLTEVDCHFDKFPDKHIVSGLEGCSLFGIAMYNETPDFLQMTLEACMKDKPRFDAAGQKAATVIMLDGIDEVHPDTVKYLKELGLWLPIDSRDDNKTQRPEAYLFEGILESDVLPASKSAGDNCDGELQRVTMDVFLLVKQDNGGKISSHCWLFNALSVAIQPFSVTILDCGTIPCDGALFNQYFSLEESEEVVVSSGNIIARLDQKWNPIQQFQYVEYYTLPCLFPINTTLGILHPTSGPMTIFRWSALSGNICRQGQKNNTQSSSWTSEEATRELSLVICDSSSSSSEKEDNFQAVQDVENNAPRRPRSISTKELIRPNDNVAPIDLYSYHHKAKLGVFLSNVYMSEDSFLGGEMIRTGAARWYPDTWATFDAPLEFTSLLKQRKRWFNGGLSVLIWQINRCWVLFFKPSNGKPLIRRIAIAFQLLWLLGWYSIQGILCYGVQFAVQQYVVDTANSTAHLSNWASALAESWLWIQVAIFLSHLGLGLTVNNPSKPLPKVLYNVVFYTHSLTYVALAYFFFQVHGTINLFDRAWYGWATMGVLLLCALIYPCVRFPRKIPSLVLCMPTFFFVLMPFCCALGIRSFCNVHDVAWGTKGLDESPKTASGNVHLLLWRFFPITVFVAVNAAVGLAFMDGPQNILLAACLFIGCTMLAALIINIYLLIWCRYFYRRDPAQMMKKPSGGK